MEIKADTRPTKTATVKLASASISQRKELHVTT